MIIGDLSFLVWIWYGSGFIFLYKIVFLCFCNINFIFYLYVILSDFVIFCVFFECCGVWIMFNDLDFLDVFVMIKEKYEIGVGIRDVIVDQKLLYDIFYWMVRGEKLFGFEFC